MGFRVLEVLRSIAVRDRVREFRHRQDWGSRLVVFEVDLGSVRVRDVPISNQREPQDHNSSARRGSRIHVSVRVSGL